MYGGGWYQWYYQRPLCLFYVIITNQTNCLIHILIIYIWVSSDDNPQTNQYHQLCCNKQHRVDEEVSHLCRLLRGHEEPELPTYVRSHFY